MADEIMTLDEEDCSLAFSIDDVSTHLQADSINSNQTTTKDLLLLAALRTQNQHLKSQVQNLTHQLQQACLSPPSSSVPSSYSVQSPPKTFYPFPLLPPELRRKIWTLALPGPRILTLTYTQPCSSRSHRSYPPKPRFIPLPPHDRPPALLSATHESRAVALGHYEWAFQQQQPAEQQQQPATVTAVATSASRYSSVFGAPPPPPPEGRRRNGTTTKTATKALNHDDDDDDDDGDDDDEDSSSSSDEACSGFYISFHNDTLFFPSETTPTLLSLFHTDTLPAEVARVRHLAVRSELPKEAMKYVVRFRGLESFRLVLGGGCCRCGGGCDGVDEGRGARERGRGTGTGRSTSRSSRRRSIWVPGAYWGHELTGWGRMEGVLVGAFEEERDREREREADGNGEYRVPKVEFGWGGGDGGRGGEECACCCGG